MRLKSIGKISKRKQNTQCYLFWKMYIASNWEKILKAYHNLCKFALDEFTMLYFFLTLLKTLDQKFTR